MRSLLKSYRAETVRKTQQLHLGDHRHATNGHEPNSVVANRSLQRLREATVGSKDAKALVS